MLQHNFNPGVGEILDLGENRFRRTTATKEPFSLAEGNLRDGCRFARMGFNHTDTLLLLALTKVHLQDRTRVVRLRLRARNGLGFVQVTKRNIMDVGREQTGVEGKNTRPPFAATEFTLSNVCVRQDDGHGLSISSPYRLFQGAEIVLEFPLIRTEPHVFARAGAFCRTQDEMGMKIGQATDQCLFFGLFFAIASRDRNNQRGQVLGGVRDDVHLKQIP
jgi:hypothetical protein